MDRLTEVVIETLCRAGVTVTCDETADGQHRITATDPDKRETYVVISPDLYVGVCEVAQALGFDLEDG